MAINFVRARDGSYASMRFQPMERLKVYLFGATVLFASLGWVKRSIDSCFQSLKEQPIVFRLRCCLVWYLPGSPLSSSQVFTEIAKRGAQGSTSFGLGIIKYEALWKESLRWPTH
jgi:hypothetical protein